MSDAQRDQNYVPSALGVSSVDSTTTLPFKIDPLTGRLLIDNAGSANIVVGTSTITGGTTTRVLYDNAGVLGEYAISGTGSVAMTTSPAFTTPSLGVATATSVNGLIITSSTGTLTITNGKTISFAKTLSFDGTDSTTITFPSTSATIARTDAGQTFTGINNFTSPDTTTSITTASTSFTAWAGATTLLTIGGTGASASLFAPSTLDTSSSITGAIRTSGGISAAKSANIGTTITVGTGYQIGGAAASGKILKGNGTNFIASTETYAAPGSSGNVMTSDGTNWTSAAAAGAGTAVTLMPKANFVTVANATQQLNSNTTMYVGQVAVPFNFTINKVSVVATAVGTTGTLKIALYSESGATKVFEVTTASIAGSGIVTTAVSSVVIAPGIYYVAILSVSTADITLNMMNMALNSFQTVTSEPVLAGTVTVTASTIPATITPTSVSANDAATVWSRWDN